MIYLITLITSIFTSFNVNKYKRQTVIIIASNQVSVNFKILSKFNVSMII